MAKVIRTILLLNPLTLSHASSNYSRLNCDLSSPVLNKLIRPRVAQLPNFLKPLSGQEPQEECQVGCKGTERNEEQKRVPPG